MEQKKRKSAFFSLPSFTIFLHLFYLFYQFDKNYATDPPRVWIYAENEDHKRSVMMVEKGNISLVCRSDARPKVTSHSWFKNVSWHSRAAALSAIKRWKIWLLFCVCAEKAPSKSFARYSLLPWVSPLMSVWEVGGKHEKKCTRWWKNPFSCCMLFCSHIVYIAWWHSALDENIQHKFMFLRMIYQHGTFPLMHSFSSTRLFLMRCREHTKNIQGIRIAGENTNILHILSLEKEDNGEYSCSAMNSEGESMSPHLNLSIECEYIWAIEFTFSSMHCSL